MRLTDLVVGNQWNDMEITGPTDADITGLTADSRNVQPGFLFAAFDGEAADGRAFIPDAIARGARAILAPRGTPRPENSGGISFLGSDLARRDYAVMTARYWGDQPETIAAVTGTNGKSSVADFTRQLWDIAGRSAASLGTLGLVSPAGIESGGLTTPDAAALSQTLAHLAKEGVDHLALEASSHGLDQSRLDGVALSIAAFTNLSRDHLDYHGSMAAYGAAKRRLFAELLPADGKAVLNADDYAYEELRSVAAERGCWIYSYGIEGDDIRLLNASATASGQELRLEVCGRSDDIFLPLIGSFQISNALCALGIVLASGIEAATAVTALASLRGVRGRMELAGRHRNGAGVYVDYAHTPDALRAALAALRPHAEGELHVVFGCGGDRDQGKRHEMGAIAQEMADQLIVTDDNPRGENPAAIRQAILAACPSALDVEDRQEAILRAVLQLAPGDLLLVAGKGHEQGQIAGDRVVPFDDVSVCRDALAGAGG
ncbi:MAG: UDP-N-acetylmuramoyl-L-alanyl-D-glutamate--2,6-diaminopimelate ligase [Rhodospirillaceae bacterium TMED167]|nr:MAG: UDP-N-acetylmuramoyl-L-alanyl-D-glutamate--2,6-diaminopimelate ligase [Rhodospirillaceae bacterium TMED167]